VEGSRLSDTTVTTVSREGQHPIDSIFPPDSMPSVWCPGCGIGTIVYTFVQAVEEMNVEPDKICVVSGIGCTGKIAEYLNFGLNKTTDGNVITYAADLAAKKQDLKVIVFTNNTDFLIASAKDFLDIGMKRANLLVIHINNVIYCITENGAIPTTPFMRASADDDFELPFNIPHLAKSSGARYVARWTPLRAGWLKYSMIDALSKPALSVIDVVSPCVMYFIFSNKIGDAVDQLRFYSDNSVMKQYEPTKNLDLRSQSEIIIGKFVDKKED
jgi:2-oxoglutarate ferredoxin oxidoreductase subunit beta